MTSRPPPAPTEGESGGNTDGDEVANAGGDVDYRFTGLVVCLGKSARKPKDARVAHSQAPHLAGELFHHFEQSIHLAVQDTS